MRRRLRIRDHEGRALAGREVELKGQGGRHFRGRLDGDGRVEFDWDDDWVDLVTVAGRPVKRDWSLSGFLSSQRELELVASDASEGEPGRAESVKRRLTLSYPGGEPVRGREVGVFDRQGLELRLESDERGVVEFAWDEDWIARVEVEQVPVKRDWSLGGWLSSQRELELEVPRLDAVDERTSDALRGVDSDWDDFGVRGRLFYQDGTQVRESYRVRVEFAGLVGSSHDTQGKGSYCRDDGSFFIATPAHDRHSAIRRVWVNDEEVPKSRWFLTEEGFYVVLVPAGFRRQGGDQGGLVAGQVVDESGTAAPRAKVSAEVRGGFLVGRTAETYSDAKGRFLLMFQGGVELKSLYVDGNAPASCRLGQGDSAREIAAKDIKAGTFGLTLVRQPRFLGLF